MNNADIKIMLVDDDEMIRECLTAYLEDEEFTVYGFVNAEEALDVIKNIDPALCISDMRLPCMNGEEFILKAYILCPETHYILHTGMFYSLSEELKAIKMTADDVLLKPVHDLQKLVLKIKKIIASKEIS